MLFNARQQVQTWSPSRKARQRKQSYFGSYSQRSPSWQPVGRLDFHRLCGGRDWQRHRRSPRMVVSDAARCKGKKIHLDLMYEQAACHHCRCLSLSEGAGRGSPITRWDACSVSPAACPRTGRGMELHHVPLPCLLTGSGCTSMAALSTRRSSRQWPLPGRPVQAKQGNRTASKSHDQIE